MNCKKILFTVAAVALLATTTAVPSSHCQGFRPFFDEFEVDCDSVEDVASGRVVAPLNGKRFIELLTRDDGVADAECNTLPAGNRFKRADALIQANCADPDAQYRLQLEFFDPLGFFDVNDYLCEMITVRRNGSNAQLHVDPSTISEFGDTTPLNSEIVQYEFENDGDDDTPDFAHIMNIISAFLNNVPIKIDLIPSEFCDAGIF